MRPFKRARECWILAFEKRVKAAAVAPDTLDQALPSACIVRRVQRFRNRRKTRCNKSDWSSFSKQSWNQLSSRKKGNAYWPTIFQVNNSNISR
jgi:hypothetical protein